MTPTKNLIYQLLAKFWRQSIILCEHASARSVLSTAPLWKAVCQRLSTKVQNALNKNTEPLFFTVTQGRRVSAWRATPTRTRRIHWTTQQQCVRVINTPHPLMGIRWTSCGTATRSSTDTADQGPEKVFRTLQTTMETTPEGQLLMDASNTSARREIPETSTSYSRAVKN